MIIPLFICLTFPFIWNLIAFIYYFHKFILNTTVILFSDNIPLLALILFQKNNIFHSYKYINIFKQKLFPSVTIFFGLIIFCVFVLSFRNKSHSCVPLKGVLHENSTSVFPWISFPRSPEYTLGAFRTFMNICKDIRKLRLITAVIDTGDKHKVANISVGAETLQRVHSLNFCHWIFFDFCK